MKKILVIMAVFFCSQINSMSMGDVYTPVDGVWSIVNKSQKVGEIHINSGEYEVFLGKIQKIEPEYFSKNHKGTVRFELKEIKLKEDILLGLLYLDEDGISYEIRKNNNYGTIYFHSRISQFSDWGILKQNEKK